MRRAVSARLPDGRLHLQHGPIDIIVFAEGPGQSAAYAAATDRFDGLLEDLCQELAALRQPARAAPILHGPVARAMQAATAPFAPAFITPMAAVAGSVADAICGSMLRIRDVSKVYANNGGDIAFALRSDARFVVQIAGTSANVTLCREDGIGGIATSGWRGRSQSLGIADSVTVLAKSAAQADAAATMIANAVDLPGHPRIERRAATALKADSDLGERLVTVAVPRLSDAERDTALNRGQAAAETYLTKGLFRAAYLTLQGAHRLIEDTRSQRLSNPAEAILYSR